ncbi:MAG: nucleotidyltransferase family protein [Dehalococcoidia bacterium]
MKLESALVGPDWPIRQVMVHIDRNSQGLVLVVDEDRRLLDTVTDGDIRRAILGGIDLDVPVETLLGRERPTGRKPVTAPAGTNPGELIRLMNEHLIRHVPILDAEGRVLDIAVMGELVREHELPITAVVMAGGYGTRLRPMTDDVPKTMLPVGDRPVLERIVEGLRKSGIRRVNLTTHYKKEVIANHFGDGREYGVEISYVEENQPLGTAGALGLLEKSKEPLLVINGDILTRLDFRAFVDFHREHQADMTVAVRQHEMQVPFGVVETEGVRVTQISEKPVLRHLMNAGIYLLDPGVRRYIPSGERYDMTDLIDRLIAEGRRVVSFPVTEYWMDIGQLQDYEKAQSDAAGEERSR